MTTLPKWYIGIYVKNGDSIKLRNGKSFRILRPQDPKGIPYKDVV